MRLQNHLNSLHLFRSQTIGRNEASSGTKRIKRAYSAIDDRDHVAFALQALPRRNLPAVSQNPAIGLQEGEFASQPLKIDSTAAVAQSFRYNFVVRGDRNSFEYVILRVLERWLGGHGLEA
jgi:hypothetical protein